MNIFIFHRYKLYADKIFNSCQLVTAAYSRRQGPLTNWMHTLNRIMSPIRVSIEWSFGKIVTRAKHAEYRQFIQQSPVNRIYNLSVLLANCNTCLYGNQSTLWFGLAPPTLHDYMSQI